MCEICGTMLAAEHKQQPGAELCPKCRRFPLDAEMPFDPSQWDYVAPDLENLVGSVPRTTQEIADVMPVEALEPPNSEETDEVPDEHVRTCYHCYQIDSGLAEPCPVCGDSYLPPAMRKPHHA